VSRGRPPAHPFGARGGPTSQVPYRPLTRIRSPRADCLGDRAVRLLEIADRRWGEVPVASPVPGSISAPTALQRFAPTRDRPLASEQMHKATAERMSHAWVAVCADCRWIGSDHRSKEQAAREAEMHERGRRLPWSVAAVAPWTPGDDQMRG